MEGKFTRGTAWALLAPRRQVTDLGVGGLYLHLLLLSSFPPPENGSTKNYSAQSGITVYDKMGTGIDHQY